MDSGSIIPLIVIVGPTASGKTALAVELAERYDGEIICADSRTVYKGMDIGTAKPSERERRRVQHWGIDLVRPDEKFTASDFKEYADSKITDIRARGKVPFLVGGTGLYIDAVIFNFQFGSLPDGALRSYLEHLTLQELHTYCEEKGIALPENENNKRFVIRTIERYGQYLKRDKSRLKDCIIVGIATNKDDLQMRIINRSEQLFSQAVVNEAKALGKKYGWDLESMTGNIYPLIRLYIQGEKSLEEIKERFISSDKSLAKRQLTWFRRNPYIVWLKKEEVEQHLKEVFATR